MKIHEYNEMMAYLTRPGKKQGGVIGKGGMFQGQDMGYRTGYSTLVARGIELAPKIPSYIQKTKNIYSKAKNIFNTFRNKNNLFIQDKPLIRQKLNEQLKDDLGYGINVNRVNKSGDLDFRLSITGREAKSSVNLPELMAERDSFVLSKTKPLYEKGYIPVEKFVELFKKKNISFEPAAKEFRNYQQAMSGFAKKYNIETIEANVPGTGGSKWYKIPSAEKWEEIRKLRLKPDEKAAEIKPLIEELEIKSHTELKKVMKDRGYPTFEDYKYNEYFPEIKGFSFTNPSFVHPGKKFNAEGVLSSIRYNLRKNMGSLKVEGFLRGAKKYEDYGEKVHTMHTTKKAKSTGETLDISDFAFGSEKENVVYARGLDDIRSGMTTTLNNIAKKHAGENPNTIVDVSLNLQKKYNFPKKMKLKDYVDRINIGLTDLAWRTNGKVRGELLDITGGKMQFIDNPVVNYGIIPGKGLIKGKIKDLEPIIKKIRMDPKTGNIILEKKPRININEKGEEIFVKDAQGNQIFDQMPAVKKGQKLTQDDAETILMIWENIKSQLPGAKKSKPFTGDFKFNEGGRVGLKDGTIWGKTKSVGETTLRGFERSAGPWMTPLVGLYTAITGEAPDMTKSENLLLPAFWDQIMKKYKWEDKSTDPIKRRIKNFFKRGAIPTRLMPFISKISGYALGPAELNQAIKAGPAKEERIAEVARDKGWDVDETLNMYRMTFDQPEFSRDFFYKKMFGKTPDLSTIQDVIKSPEYKERKKYFTNAAIDQYWENKETDPIRLRTLGPDVMRGSVVDKYNQGGRVGLKEGSPKSPGRRAFIKGITALAALPIVGKYFKLGKVLERASTYTGPAIQKIKGMPEWFPGLVKKLWNEGEDVTKKMAYKERMVVKRGTLEGGDDVDMIYDMDTGDVSIDVTPKKGKYETSSGAYNKEYSLDYKKGELVEEGKYAGKTAPDEFSFKEIEGRMTPDAADIDWDVNYTTVDDAVSDLTELEAFAKNKTTKQIHKKKGTNKKDVFPDYDYDIPDDY